MHKDIRADRAPSPPRSRAYHSQKGLATAIARRIAATMRNFGKAWGPRARFAIISAQTCLVLRHVFLELPVLVLGQDIEHGLIVRLVRPPLQKLFVVAHDIGVGGCAVLEDGLPEVLVKDVLGPVLTLGADRPRRK